MNILIVKTTSLGDVIHTFPALTDAAKANPHIEFDWLVEESFQNIPKWHSRVRQVIPVAMRRWRKPNRQSLGEMKDCYKRLRHQQYDMVIDAQGLLKSALLAKLTKTRQLVGYDASSIKEPFASKLYHRHITTTAGVHAVPKVRELFAKALQYDHSVMPLDYGISEYFLDNHGDDNEDINCGPYVVFLHGTTWASKHWPIHYWQTLGQLLNHAGLSIVLSWGNEAEKHNASVIASQINNVKILPKQPIEKVAKLLLNAEMAIAVDTGIGHLAAALSVPCISIYGSTDASKTGAMGNNQEHLSVNYSCAPCLKKTCQFSVDEHENHPPCYETQNAEKVYSAALKLLAKEKTPKIVIR